MADFTYGVQKVNGIVPQAGEDLTIALDFWTITTAVNILVSGTGATAASQAAFDKLVEIVSLNGQPVILNAPTATSGAAPYQVTFAVEHNGSWNAGAYQAGAVAPMTGPQTLINAIQVAGVNYGFATDATLTATVSSNLPA